MPDKDQKFKWHFSTAKSEAGFAGSLRTAKKPIYFPICLVLKIIESC